MAGLTDTHTSTDSGKQQEQGIRSSAPDLSCSRVSLAQRVAARHPDATDRLEQVPVEQIAMVWEHRHKKAPGWRPGAVSSLKGKQVG